MISHFIATVPRNAILILGFFEIGPCPISLSKCHLVWLFVCLRANRIPCAHILLHSEPM